MPSYTLIEYKLRKYFYLGHEYSMYVPPSIRNSFWAQSNHDDMMGVRIIGKIVKKNNSDAINSIVPIILKIKEEGILHDERHLIFALAICARFNLKPCSKMVAAAYKAVPIICTDGLKMLMFVQFCNIAKVILHERGYLPESENFGFGRGFRNAMKKWYLDRDPLVTAELIIRNNRFEGWTHKDIMKLIHIHSDDPSRQIFIIHTMCGMKKVEEIFGSKLKDIQIENDEETFENKQLKFIYNFLKQIENLNKMDENTLRNEIELNRWGHIPEVIPKKMSQNPQILTSLVMHMPLRKLLDNTFFFAKQKLFCNTTPDVGLWEFILRFNNIAELKKSKIHPIEPFLAYVKYSRNITNVLRWQNEMFKNENTQQDLPENKLVYLINNQINDGEISQQPEGKESTSQSTVNNKRKSTDTKQALTKNKYFKQIENYKKCCLDVNPTIVKGLTPKQKKEKVKSKPQGAKTSQIFTDFVVLELNKKIEPQDTSTEIDKKVETQNNLPDTCNLLSSLSINTKQTNAISDVTSKNDDNIPMNLIMIKPLPRIVEHLTKFLSVDLIKKTLENLKSSDRNIMIAYDPRQFTERKMCLGASLLNVQEAIILIVMSLIYPEKSKKQPTLCALQELSDTVCNKVEVNYSKDINFTNVKFDLFTKPLSDHDSSLDGEKIQPVYPASIVKWATDSQIDFDVFVFLGTNNMDFKGINYAKKAYKEALKKTPKIVTCCLNGKHSEQKNLSRDNMLFIAGFDKNVGNIIASFINDEF